MVRQNYMSAVGNKEIAIHFHAGVTQHSNFFQESQRIEHHPVANHGATASAQHSARNQLENKFLALDNDGMAGVVSSGVTGNNGKVLGKDVNDFAFAFIAPLGTHNHGGLCVFHLLAHSIARSCPSLSLGIIWETGREIAVTQEF